MNFYVKAKYNVKCVHNIINLKRQYFTLSKDMWQMAWYKQFLNIYFQDAVFSISSEISLTGF